MAQVAQHELPPIPLQSVVRVAGVLTVCVLALAGLYVATLYLIAG